MHIVILYPKLSFKNTTKYWTDTKLYLERKKKNEKQNGNENNCPIVTENYNFSRKTPLLIYR